MEAHDKDYMDYMVDFILLSRRTTLSVLCCL